jgi:hypothetical protein
MWGYCFDRMTLDQKRLCVSPTPTGQYAILPRPWPRIFASSKRLKMPYKGIQRRSRSAKFGEIYSSYLSASSLVAFKGRDKEIQVDEPEASHGTSDHEGKQG